MRINASDSRHVFAFNARARNIARHRSPSAHPFPRYYLLLRTGRVIFRGSHPLYRANQQEVPFAFPGLDVAFNCILSSGMSPMRILILRRYYERRVFVLPRQPTGISRFDNIIVARLLSLFSIHLSLSLSLSLFSLSFFPFFFLFFSFRHGGFRSDLSPKSVVLCRKLRRKYCWFVARTVTRTRSLILLEKFRKESEEERMVQSTRVEFKRSIIGF